MGLRTSANRRFPSPEVLLDQHKNKITEQEDMNMLTKGGQRAATGTYWNLKDGDRVDMEQEGVLPGTERSIYIKASSVTVLLAGPILGLLFAVFLPFIGIAMTFMLVAGKVVDSVTSAAAGSMSFGWRPVEAYLTGKKRRGEARQKKSAKEKK